MVQLDQHALPPGQLSDEIAGIFSDRESNVRSYCRSFPAVFSRAKGALLFDLAGRSYIDFLAGAGALNFGHNHDSIKQALIEYVSDDGLAHGLDLHTSAKAAFLDDFVSQILEPRGLDYKVQFTGPTGTNSVEAALKIARRATGRSGVFAFMGGYHGDSLGSLAATANRDHRRAAGIDLNGVTFLPYPGGPIVDLDTIAYLRSVLLDSHSGIELPAAVLVETVQAEGGVNVAPIEWLQELRAICDDHGIVLIVDEVQTGVGRTGPFFSFERAGIVPDVVTLSKSISGSGQPMALTLMRPALDVWQPGEHTGTFRGNQLAFVTGRVALSLFEKEGIEQLTESNARAVAQQLEHEVAALDDRLQLRGIGMLWGVDTAAVDPSGQLAGAIARISFAEGLVIERVGRNDTVLKILPPLTIEAAELREGISILATATARHFDAERTQLSTPKRSGLATHLRAVREAERESFHMPGHRGGPGAPAEGLELLGPNLYASDLSELGGFDYLHNAKSGLATAQEEAAHVFGVSKTYFLVNGSTVGNLALVMATATDGDEVLLARASHRSTYAGLVLSGAQPLYLEPLANEKIDVLCGVDLEELSKTLDEHRDVRAVHVTSPSFYGFTLPLEEIAEITSKRGVALLVDEAHGTHFAFHKAFPTSALAAGADGVVQSAHKTLGSLTQSSLLHLGSSGRIDPDRVHQVLQMLESSSPSSILLVSLDVAITDAADSGTERWAEALQVAELARALLESLPGLRVYGDELIGTPGIAGYDPTKIVVDVSGIGATGPSTEAWLSKEAGVNAEFSDLRHLVFSFAPGVSDDSARLLADGFAAFAASDRTAVAPRAIASRWPRQAPPIRKTPRAGFAASSVSVDVGDALGHIAAEMIVPYPPGIPLAVPGEELTEDVLATLTQYLAQGCAIVGVADPSGATIRCWS